MRYLGILIVALTSPWCPPATASDAAVSWRKPGNSYARFVQDSVTCAKHGYFRDVAKDEPAKAFVRGWQTADDNLNAATDNPTGRAEQWADSQRRTQPARRLREVQALQVGDVEQCLTRLGYSKFTLTKDQARTLKTLQRGSEARRQYLYALSVQ